MLELFVVSIVVAFLAGVGVGSLLLAARIAGVISLVVANTHQEYADVERTTKELIAAGVTRLEEIKKVL
jgi:hypothetical protein